MSGMAHFFVVVSGSKIHERVAHFFIDIYTPLEMLIRTFILPEIANLVFFFYIFVQRKYSIMNFVFQVIFHINVVLFNCKSKFQICFKTGI